jgi:hypothetical protein
VGKGFLKWLGISDSSSSDIVISEDNLGINVQVRRGKRLDQADYKLIEEARQWVRYTPRGELKVNWREVPSDILRHKNVKVRR